MVRGEQGKATPVVVRDSAWTHVIVWIGFPVAGALVLWALKLAAGWVASLPWAPFQGPFELVASIPEPLATLGALAIGAAAGLVIAVLAAQDSLTVSVEPEVATLVRGGSEQTFGHDSIESAFRDGKDLVLLGRNGAELTRESSDLDTLRLADAFRSQGYRWLEEDPYAGEFRRWVPDTPDLPTGADALLKAREKTLDKVDSSDARELRGELAKLGVVVRDKKKRQYWRLVRA